jgi:hypothetical protein
VQVFRGKSDLFPKGWSATTPPVKLEAERRLRLYHVGFDCPATSVTHPAAPFNILGVLETPALQRDSGSSLARSLSQNRQL